MSDTLHGRAWLALEVVLNPEEWPAAGFEIEQVEGRVGISGFSALIDPFTEPLAFQFNPIQIAETCEDLTIAAYFDYLDSILDWWLASTIYQRAGLNIELSFEKFAREFPLAAAPFLSHPAILAGTPLTEWLYSEA